MNMVSTATTGNRSDFWESFTTSYADHDDVTEDAWNTPSGEFWEYRLSLQIIAYSGVIIVATGIVGNIMCIATLLESKTSSTTVYLVNLACADLLCIVVGHLGRVLPRGLTGYDVTSYHPGICQAWMYLNGLGTTVSAWTLVAVTAERVVVVYLPFKAKVICTKFKALITIATIDVFCSAYFVHYFWSYGAVYVESPDGSAPDVLIGLCTITRNLPELTQYMRRVRPWLDLLVRSAIPFICLLTGNCLIVGKLLVAAARRRSLSQQSAVDVKESRARAMTVTLLTISFVHLFCTSPMQIMTIVDKSDPFGKEIEHEWQASAALRWSVAISLYYVNNCCNFFLYCVSGAEFRASLKGVCTKCYVRRGAAERHDVEMSRSTSVSNI